MKKLRQARWMTILVVAGIVLFGAFSAWAATLEVGPGKSYTTIQAAIDVAGTGDIINVAAGTYTPSTGRLIINKEITLQADPSLNIQGPGPMNRPKIAMNYFSWTSCAIQIGADNVVFDGFEVDNGGWDSGGYIVGDYNSPKNGWTVRNCEIHGGRMGIRLVGDNVAIEGNNIYETRGDCIDAEYGNCLGLKVTHNWLHSHHTDSGKKPAGLTYHCSVENGNDVEITYNYCWACRTFVDFESDGSNSCPLNYNIVVAHNTVDWWIGDLPDTPASSDIAQQMSLAWWASGGAWNAPKFEIRDNLFTRQKWYAVVDTDLFLQGQLMLQNNMFWQWYLADSWYPDYKCPNEWPSARGAVGWDDMGVGNEFVMNGCITGDPLYAATDTTPDEYYALKYNKLAGVWHGQRWHEHWRLAGHTTSTSTSTSV